MILVLGKINEFLLAEVEKISSNAVLVNESNWDLLKNNLSVLDKTAVW